MQKGHLLQFDCQACKNPIEFSIFDLDDPSHCIECNACQKKYLFNDETLVRQLKKFDALCKQLIDSEEILSNASVGVNVGDRQVKVPYKLLLTRFTSNLDLIMGNQTVSIRFRIEPLKDTPK
jgi:hypothetical protein